MTNKEMSDFLLELRSRQGMPVDQEEYDMIGEIASALLPSKRIVDADALVEEIKYRADCMHCINYAGIKCRSCGWDDAISLIDDYADNHPYVVGEE